MNKEFIKHWLENRDRLENWFRTTEQSRYNSYQEIVKKLFEICFAEVGDGFNTGSMTVIDDGHYQGTQIFILPLNGYQPSIEDYVVTNSYYGSCSGCDTLQAICDYEHGLPTEDQVKSYMTLALHLVQRINWLDGRENQ
jgi:hypothetical protein